MIKKHYYKIITLAIVLIITLGLAFSKSIGRESKKEVYKTSIITKGDGRSYINVEGKIEANDTKQIFVDKKLKVKEVFVKEGDYVEKGKILMTFDETERNKVKRNLELENLNLAKLKRDEIVEKELYKLGGSSTNFIKSLEENIRKVEIEIEGYEEELEKTSEKIISPVSGTIASLTAQENYLVDTDSSLLEISDLSDVKIILEVPEYDLKNIVVGQKLIVKPEVFQKKRSFKGEILKISRISKKSSITSENIVEVEVKLYEKIPYIVPGFKISGTIFFDNSKDKIMIPKTSLLIDEEKNYFVYSYKNGVIKKQIIKMKITEGDSAIVISGLEEGVEILINPTEKLKEGDKVERQISEVKRGNKERSEGKGESDDNRSEKS